MTIILAFTAASFVASALVLSACALSSQLSQQEGLVESFAEVAKPEQVPAKTTAPFSLN